MFVYVVFHPRTRKDIIALKNRFEHMKKHGDEYRVRIQQPILKNDEMMTQFFKELNSVFISFSHMSPHFSKEQA